MSHSFNKFTLTDKQLDGLHEALKARAADGGGFGMAYEEAARMLFKARMDAHKERSAKVLAKLKQKHQLGV